MFVLFARLLQAVTRRTEVYIALSALVCILVAALLFAHFEHLTFFTALYWSVVTASTVGYGDIAPHTEAGRIVTIGVIMTSVPLFGALFSIVAARIAEAKIRRLVGMEHVGWRKNHIVVLGDGDETMIVLEALKATGQLVLVAEDVDPTTIPSDVAYIKGDPRDPHVIAKAHATTARHAVITGTRDGDILETAIALREVAADIPITVSTKSALAARALRALGITNTLMWQELLGHTLAKSLQAPHASGLLLQLVNSDEFVIEEIPATSEMIGKSFRSVRNDYPHYILGMAQNDEVLLGVRRNPVISQDTTLLILKPKE